MERLQQLKARFPDLDFERDKISAGLIAVEQEMESRQFMMTNDYQEYVSVKAEQGEEHPETHRAHATAMESHMRVQDMEKRQTALCDAEGIWENLNEVYPAILAHFASSQRG